LNDCWWTVTFPLVALRRRAELHAALGDPGRLAIVDELTVSDRSPRELSVLLGISPSLLSFHLDALEQVGLVQRVSSSGDRRRKYVQLVPTALEEVSTGRAGWVGPVVFVCTRNSARSQLAAAIWRSDLGSDSASAGTEPADRVHPGAVEAARRAGLDLGDARPRRLDPETPPERIVTVCDQAHEELARGGVPTTRHWSITDPVTDGTDGAFERALDEIRRRIAAIRPSLDTSTVDTSSPRTLTSRRTT
jgi:protein-tyrosine-phosphatase/DNA-binding HxlR family transcriptional regulator